MNVYKIKDAVRARDGMRCTQCGMTAEEHIESMGRTLDVHRLVPGSPYTVEGCVTLCVACHGGKPKRPQGSRAFCLSADLALKADLIAKLVHHVPLAEYLSELLRPHIEKEWPKALAILNRQEKS